MEEKSKAEADEVPEGFTLGLAIVDGIPVIEFCASMIVIATRFSNPLFVAGAICSALAGCGKVLWKVILACAGRNVAWLNRQFRYLMGTGFLLMLIAVVANWRTLQFGLVLQRAFSMPSGIFFGLGLVGLVAMGAMGAKLDRNVARNNWIEQITNSVAQAMILVGVLLY